VTRRAARGDVYPSLIRKTETKPLRVSLQSGKRDMNTYAGSWYLQNQAMATAFEYLGYGAKVVLGEEGHNDLQGSSILPDALRWLWRDYPQPIAKPRPPANREWATDIVVPDKDWEVVGEGYQSSCLSSGFPLPASTCMLLPWASMVWMRERYGPVPFQ
jgi:hypothetical protein